MPRARQISLVPRARALCVIVSLQLSVLLGPFAVAPRRAAASPGGAAVRQVLPHERYHPPVDAPIVDHFRPPAVRWGPGNRGIKYATTPGTPVSAVGPGCVTFAGVIAGQAWVTVLHPDGIRTSLSVATLFVRAGDAVSGHTIVGLAGPLVHLGARRGDVYIDPESLFGREVAPPRVVLVAPDGHGPPALGAAPGDGSSASGEIATPSRRAAGASAGAAAERDAAGDGSAVLHAGAGADLPADRHAAGAVAASAIGHLVGATAAGAADDLVRGAARVMVPGAAVGPRATRSLHSPAGPSTGGP